MAANPNSPTADEAAAALRRKEDELGQLRSELARARADLAAMEDRFVDLEARARLGIAADRLVANTEFLERQEKALARHNRLLRLARPFRGSRLFAPLERTARRLRAARQG